MQKCYLYCDKRSLNSATVYYINLITECLQAKGYDIDTVHDKNDIHNPSIIFTVTERYFLVGKLFFPKAKTIYWAQGVEAEEAKANIHCIKDYARYVVRRYSESIAVRKADLLVCVSKRQVDYYEQKYGYNKKGAVVVMPCYNLHLSDSFDKSQYSSPTFVYAGNASGWQGVDFMLSVYSRVESRLGGSCRLVLLTNDVEEFKKKIESEGIKNAEMKFVPLSELQDELHKYKYGFIIRDGSIINQVATPTKMNSYLASYVIPIYSDSVQDFVSNIKLGEFTLMAKCPLNSDEIAEKIIQFEKEEKDYNKFEQYVKSIFDGHYNDEYYQGIIRTMIEQYLDS